MDEEFIDYIRTYERELYLSCLSTDYTEGEGGEAYNKRRVFDEDLWLEISHSEREQIEEEYRSFKNGTFEDSALSYYNKIKLEAK